jgi:hypothetical protein
VIVIAQRADETDEEIARALDAVGSGAGLVDVTTSHRLGA